LSSKSYTPIHAGRVEQHDVTVAGGFLEHTTKEEGAADLIAERLTQLGGEPDDLFHLAALIARESVLVLDLLRFASELRDPTRPALSRDSLKGSRTRSCRWPSGSSRTWSSVEKLRRPGPGPAAANPHDRRGGTTRHVRPCPAKPF